MVPVIITSIPKMEAMVTRLDCSVNRRIFFVKRCRNDSYLSIESTLDGAESRVKETRADSLPFLLVLDAHSNKPGSQRTTSFSHVIFLDEGDENRNVLLVDVAFRS